MSEVKERPILFSGPMVQAILDGRKTQTRRVVKFPGNVNQAVLSRWHFGQWGGFGRKDAWTPLNDFGGIATHAFHDHHVFCPYGKVGDRLWVRETHATVAVPRGTTANSFITVYRADDPQGLLVPNKWKPSIFMRRHDSRITLEITSVRVERLQDISDEDAQAEGVPIDDEPCDHYRQSCEAISCFGPGYRASFCDLWERINGKKHPWASNPFVWVVEFRRVDAN